MSLLLKNFFDLREGLIEIPKDMGLHEVLGRLSRKTEIIVMFVRFLRWTRFRYASLFLQKVIEPFDSKDLMCILLCLEALYIENMRVNPIMFLFSVELLPQLRVNDDLLLLWFYLNLFRVYFFVLLSGLL